MGFMYGMLALFVFVAVIVPFMFYYELTQSHKKNQEENPEKQAKNIISDCPQSKETKRASPSACRPISLVFFDRSALFKCFYFGIF